MVRFDKIFEFNKPVWKRFGASESGLSNQPFIFQAGFLRLRLNMKWFKHETDSLMSEGIEYLIEKEGMAGYGRWNRLLEIVAFKMDESNKCSVEYPISKWCSLLKLKKKKLISFLELTHNQLKTKVTNSENIIRIEIPNLLKKRDNYTRHLQETSKQLESIDIDVDIDKEVEVEVKKIHSPNFDLIWKMYPNKDGRKEAGKHFKATVKTDQDWNDINKALNNYLKNLKVQSWKKPKNGSTWFNNWQDWVDWVEPAQSQEDKPLSEKDYNDGKF